MSGWVQVPLGEMYNPVFFISTVYAIHGDTYVPVYPASRTAASGSRWTSPGFFQHLGQDSGHRVHIYGTPQWEK